MINENTDTTKIYQNFIRFLKTLDPQHKILSQPEDDLKKYIEELCDLEENMNKKEELIKEYNNISRLVIENSRNVLKGHFIKYVLKTYP